MEIVRTENLGKKYGAGVREVCALDDINISIEEGEFIAIVGPSGSGKTTLLNLVGGLDKPTNGKVFLDGRDFSTLKGNEIYDFRLNHVGFIFQSFNLIPVLTAEENIEFVMTLQGIDKDTRKSRVRDILDAVGLKGYENRRPLQMSGGQQQRVAVARAIISKPRIVLADEPTANLDSKTANELLDIMKVQNEENRITFIFSTHDKMIMEKAKRIIRLRDGKVVN